jgi:hypothetical protein
MRNDDDMTIGERIRVLEGAVVLARREINMTSLEFTAANDTGKATKDGDVRARLLALGAVIAKAEDKLALLYAVQREAEEIG